MRIVYQRCCGMDVHKNSITACLMLIGDDGEFRSYKREFGTMTRGKVVSCAFFFSRACARSYFDRARISTGCD
jgi:hypothetical protein